MGPGRALWVFLAFPAPCHMSPVEGQVLPRTRCCGPGIQTSLTAPTLARRPHPVALDSWDQLDTGLIHLEAFHLTLIWNSLGQWNFPRTDGRGSMGPGMQAGEPAAEGAPFCCTRACSSRSGVARRARGALQQTWADDAALSVWQEKGDGIRDGARLIDTRQRHQHLSMRHTRRPRASPCARVCPKPRAAGDEAGPGPAPAGGVWAPGPEEPGAELRCATYQRGGPGQVPFWASRDLFCSLRGPSLWMHLEGPRVQYALGVRCPGDWCCHHCHHFSDLLPLVTLKQDHCFSHMFIGGIVVVSSMGASAGSSSLPLAGRRVGRGCLALAGRPTQPRGHRRAPRAAAHRTGGVRGSSCGAIEHRLEAGQMCRRNSPVTFSPQNSAVTI